MSKIFFLLILFIPLSSMSKDMENFNCNDLDEGYNLFLKETLDRTNLLDELDPEFAQKNDIVVHSYKLKHTGYFLIKLELDGFSNLFLIEKNKNKSEGYLCYISKLISLGRVEYINDFSNGKNNYIELVNYPKGTGLQKQKVIIQYDQNEFFILP